MLFGADGLALTIGYLMVEAESTQIMTRDQKTWPARAVAYNQATGFGLIRSLTPLRGLIPARLGSASQLAVGVPLMVSTGSADGRIELPHLLRKRSFSGYWEYHIECALFTSPAVANHSGAPLFDQPADLVGIASLFLAAVLGRRAANAWDMFVPIDLLKTSLDERQAIGSTRQSHRPWLWNRSTRASGRMPARTSTSVSRCNAVAKRRRSR